MKTAASSFQIMASVEYFFPLPFFPLCAPYPTTDHCFLMSNTRKEEILYLVFQANLRAKDNQVSQLTHSGMQGPKRSLTYRTFWQQTVV